VDGRPGQAQRLLHAEAVRCGKPRVSPILRNIRDVRFHSVLARKVLARYYRDGRVYRVPFGPIRGARLRYARGVDFHTMLGLRELRNFRFLLRVVQAGSLLQPKSVACDVGANIGTYSLWFSRQCGQVYAFEAAPDSVTRLRDTLALNDVRNAEVIAAACIDRTGPVDFFVGSDHHSASLSSDWAGGGRAAPSRFVVDGITLDGFFYGAQSRTGPTFIKMDIEGGGVLALKGCRLCCQRARPFFLIESHTPDEDRAIGEVLVGHAYHAYRIDTQRWVRFRDRVHPDPEGVWGTMFLCPAEFCERLQRLLGMPP